MYKKLRSNSVSNGEGLKKRRKYVVDRAKYEPAGELRYMKEATPPSMMPTTIGQQMSSLFEGKHPNHQLTLDITNQGCVWVHRSLVPSQTARPYFLQHFSAYVIPKIQVNLDFSLAVCGDIPLYQFIIVLVDKRCAQSSN